ncbi:MAG TPA: HAD-IIB family hydrolase, partial [Longimicrobiales bacterium]|nr:HAD-IIB family hydrolase [Longimicrobiales bacterium]
MMDKRQPLRICLISVHGLIRGQDLELGRDADTGGQTKYVVELAKALAADPEVGSVDLLTRRIVDGEVDASYGEPLEDLGGGARIVRIEAGPPGYLPKESLWDHLDGFVDNAVTFFDDAGRPGLLHSHYADAGYVGSRLSHMMGLPLVHTGHSLGRVKRRRLLATGLSASSIEERYNMARRIDAEETTLASAVRVITSTDQEIEEQYGLYDYYQPDQMRVIPPGIDLTRFHPPVGGERAGPMPADVERFLCEPDRPMILAIARADPRKNIGGLLVAYGEDPELRDMANLVIVAGNRDDIVDLDAGAQEVLTDMLRLIDRYDLYGHVAYPKNHAAEEVPELFRVAAATRGVFVNPALTEPFGLTLIEAAASGLPIVATADGGPRDIIRNCRNGVLIDPLDPTEIAGALKEMLGDTERWEERASSGVMGVKEHYSWAAHVRHYLDMVGPIVDMTADPLPQVMRSRRPDLYSDRALFTDLDQNLLGDRASLARLITLLREKRQTTLFGIATGRRLDSALKVMKEYGIPEPDVLITSGGTSIHYAPKLTEDTAWTHHIEKHWIPRLVRRVLDPLPGLLLQPKVEQSRFKISYYIDPEQAPSLPELRQLLHQEEQEVNVILSFGQFLDVLPIRASKGLALRFVASRRDLALNRILAAGGSGADEDMLRGNTLAV